MTAQPVEQRSLFELPTPTNYDGLPVSPYPTVPYARGSETSRGAAVAIAPKQGTLQARVLLALLRTPGLSDEGLDRVLGTTHSRSARPRRASWRRRREPNPASARCPRLPKGEPSLDYR